MSLSPNSSLVRRTIDLNYENKKRANSLKWIAVNGILFAIFIYDLSCKCPGYTSILHYVELGLATVLAANLIQHTLQLLPRRAASVAISPTQQKLLGLSDADLDSSFVISKADISSSSAIKDDDAWPVDALSISSRMQQARDTSPPSSPPSPNSPPSPHSPHISPRNRSSPLTNSPHSPERFARDEFISDSRGLADYLRQYEERSRAEETTATEVPAWGLQLAPAHSPALHYQLATEAFRSSEEGGPVPALRRLQLDPQRLTQFNLNLRLWIHVTILERLANELDRPDAGQGLAPFLAIHTDQQYLIKRIKELSRGGCMSAYKWDGGSSDWDESRPPDAELVLRLVATYLDTQLPSNGGTKPFTDGHLSVAPNPPPRGPRVLGIHRVTMRPPHYVLVLEEEIVEVCRGRNNMLHTLLMFVAAAARAQPPALRRVHLGRAGLNMLWIIGR